MKCECCGRRLLPKMGRQKYCENCAIYTKTLKKQFYYWRSLAKKLTKEKYGQENGSERLR